MITINKDELCICISNPQPQNLREDIIKALAAAIRWKASYDELYTGDDFNLYMIAQLLEKITMSE